MKPIRSRAQRRFLAALATVTTHLYRLEQAEKPRTQLRQVRKMQHDRIVGIRKAAAKKADLAAQNEAARTEWKKLKPEVATA